MPLWQDLLKQVFSFLTGDPKEIFKYCEAVFDVQGKPTIPSGEYLRLAQRFELARERLNRKRANKGETLIPGIHELVQKTLTDGYNQEEAKNAAKAKKLLDVKRLPLPTWVTTNFDAFLEDTVFEEGISSGTDVILSRPISNVDFATLAGGGRTLLKIYGTVTSSDPVNSIVITEEDYHRFLRSDRYIMNNRYTLFCEKTVVFLGHSLNDPNVQFIYHEVLFTKICMAWMTTQNRFCSKAIILRKS